MVYPLNKGSTKRFITISLVTVVFLISGCKKSNNQIIEQTNTKAIEKDNLERRVQKLEGIVKNLNSPKSKKGPIKSITLRLGTNDDRLRIYWLNGVKTDLPCTREQAIWVCG